jgi:hypothetical protein
MSEPHSEFSRGIGGQGPGVPDASRSTAEFRAFANSAGESEAPWSMRAPGRKVALLAGAVIGVALVLVIIALVVANS